MCAEHTRVARWGSTGRVHRWLGTGLDLVFPPACAFCHAALESSRDGMLCDECRAILCDDRETCRRCGSLAATTAGPEGCPRCRGHRFSFEFVVRLAQYEGALRTAVLRMKRPHGRGLAAALGDLLATERGASMAAWQPDAVVPIPMHWSRRIWRGANSAQTLAERLSAHLAIPLADPLLVRRKRTAPQASLSANKRRANVRRAFRARAHRDLPGARLLLVDDIMTTGATVHEAAKTLVRAGAAAIGVVVLARAEGLG